MTDAFSLYLGFDTSFRHHTAHRVTHTIIFLMYFNVCKIQVIFKIAIKKYITSHLCIINKQTYIYTHSPKNAN